MTVCGSTHMPQPDFAVQFPNGRTCSSRPLTHPQRGMYLTVKPSLEFLKIVLPRAQTLSYNISDWVENGLPLKPSPDSEMSVKHEH